MDLSAVFLAGLGASSLASIVAYVGAWRLQNVAIQRRERGSARAVYYEIATITSDLVISLENGLPMPPVSTATYDRAAGDLALFLAPRDFDVVGFAYYSVHLFQWGANMEGTNLPAPQIIIERLGAARDVLERAAFNSDESAARRQGLG